LLIDVLIRIESRPEAGVGDGSMPGKTDLFHLQKLFPKIKGF
jgi:hypothetical protein